MIVRKALKERREKRFRVKEFADLLGISASFYYKIESGLRNPTMELAKKMADLLDGTLEELFFASEMDEPSIPEAKSKKVFKTTQKAWAPRKGRGEDGREKLP